MKKIYHIIMCSTLLCISLFFVGIHKIGATNPLDRFHQNGQFIGVTEGGQEIENTLILFARDLKNIFFVVATIFFLVIVIRLIFANNTDEEVAKFKKGIIWITVGIAIMQAAYVFTLLLFDQGVGTNVAFRFFENLVWPLVQLLQTLASFFFIAIAIYAFYRLVTANGNEEAISSAKKTIGFALIGFIILRFAREIVEAFYGTVNCEPTTLGGIIVGERCLNTQDFSSGIQIIITIINWLNGFVAIVVVIMIIYAGAQILLSGGDSEKLKKYKNSIIYIAIGITILVANYLILTFFLKGGF